MPPFLSLMFVFYFLHFSLSQPLKGKFINCGATVRTVSDDREWLPDDGFVFYGIPRNLSTPNLVPILSTVRNFPLQGNVGKKFCYVVPVYRTGKYLVRTTYFYGEFNGKDFPPVFDQIVDGTFWSSVNTTEDYVEGRASYYEGVFVATGKTMSMCIASNPYTDSDPFISALEFVLLADSLYNSTDFKRFGLSLVARHSFGQNGSSIRYPDDQFDRLWEPFGESNHTIERFRNVSVSGFWNLPPVKIFQKDMGMAPSETLELQWPPSSLPNSTYYIALYFVDDPDPSSSRVFNIRINEVIFYQYLNVTSAGAVVFANQWPLGGNTKISLTPASGSLTGPLINAGEAFDILVLGGRTLTRDVVALGRMKDSFQNPPVDWNGDPCLPRQYAWTGVTCSEGPRIRIIALNLTSMDLSGSLSHSIAKLTALDSIWLGNNSLSGSIPDLSPLKRLKILHLEDNDLSGEIPTSLGNIKSLHELFLQGNNLTGLVPSSLVGKPGLDLRISPGNPLLSATPH